MTISSSMGTEALTFEEAQSRLLATEVDAIGRLSAGAAYELEAPLSRMLLDLRTLAERNGPRADADRHQATVLRRLLRAAEQIEHTVRGLRAFTSVENSAAGVDVHEAIELAVHLTRDELTTRARLSRSYTAVRRARGSLAGVTHALINVLRNAAASIPPMLPQTNRITVETALTPEGAVVIEVSDTGVGIEPADLPFVFDPFFSTAQGGPASGLGLASARAAVLAMGGTIGVESNPGRGSRFRITLPVLAENDTAPLPFYDRETRPVRRVLCVAETVASARSLGDLIEDGDAQLLFASCSEALERLAIGESYHLVLCAAEVQSVGFREQLAMLAPEAVTCLFTVPDRSTAAAR